jgi:hypothetical protein
LANGPAFVLLLNVPLVPETDMGEFGMRYPTGPLFRPFDYALMVIFAMAFVLLTALRMA